MLPRDPRHDPRFGTPMVPMVGGGPPGQVTWTPIIGCRLESIEICLPYCRIQAWSRVFIPRFLSGKNLATGVIWLFKLSFSKELFLGILLGSWACIPWEPW